MQFTNNSMLETALQQSAVDAGCQPEDFLRQDNVVVLSRKNPAARKYLDQPLACSLISYGNNVVASVEEPYRALVTDYVNRFPMHRCFETPQLHLLDDALQVKGLRVCYMAQCFLPDLGRLEARHCHYEMRLLHPEDFTTLYTPQWSNALCEKRKELDVLGVGAYDSGRLIALAACSADCESMWQIGVDVLPEYRREGIASALTGRLTLKILERGKVPFYCAAWSNIPSVRTAIRSGFRPAWVELTAKSTVYVAGRNGPSTLGK